jgi:ribosomal protein S18 acetylase RimI-like enzyme
MSVSLANLQIVPFNPETHDVSGFDCDDSDLNDFLKSDAAKYQSEHLSCTRLAFLDGVIVGYLTILADCIILKSGEKRHLFDFHQSVYTFSALKIGRIGVQKELQRKNHIGTQLLKYAISLAIRLNQELHIGCRFITLDAYPRSIGWYKKNGFAFNKHYNSPEKTHPSMRFDIVKSTMISLNP